VKDNFLETLQCGANARYVNFPWKPIAVIEFNFFYYSLIGEGVPLERLTVVLLARAMVNLCFHRLSVNITVVSGTFGRDLRCKF